MPASFFQRSAAWIRGTRSALGRVAERSATYRALRDAMPQRATSNWGWYIANEMRTGGWRAGLAATRRYFAGTVDIPGQGLLFDAPEYATSYRLRVMRRAGAVGAMMGAAAMINPGQGREDRERMYRYYRDRYGRYFVP